MTKLTMVAFLLLAAISNGFSQETGSVKGTVTDTLNKQNLSNAVVAVLRAKDSVLVKYTRTTKEGNFDFTQFNSG